MWKCAGHHGCSRAVQTMWKGAEHGTALRNGPGSGATNDIRRTASYDRPSIIWPIILSPTLLLIFVNTRPSPSCQYVGKKKNS